MKICIRTIMAGPDGNHHPGDIVDMPKERAIELLNGGYAEAVHDGESEFADLPLVAETPIVKRVRKPKK